MFAQILVIVFCALVNNATSTRNIDLIMPPEPLDIDGILDSIAEKSRFELHGKRVNYSIDITIERSNR